MNELDIRPSTDITVHEVSGFEMRPRSLDEAMKFCELMANSDLVPNSYKGKPGNIMVAIQMGQELGMTPMRSLRSIAVINGRASMWGDEMLAMVLASPVCEYVDESQSTDKVGICKTKRKGCAEQVSTFTLEDAKRAGLLGKQGPWQTNTARMLKLRARGFGLRDTFADVLAGLVATEEALDTPEEKPVGTTAELPKSLKERLRVKVETVTEPEGAAPAARVEDGPERSSVDHPNSQPATQDTPPPPYIADDKFPFDPHKGKPISDESITDHELEDCLWAMNKYIKDPKKAAYKARNEELAIALEAELDRRRGQGSL